jgi:hypothetical protein
VVWEDGEVLTLTSYPIMQSQLTRINTNNYHKDLRKSLIFPQITGDYRRFWV